MTRIDCIPPHYIPTQHVRSGYREMLRVRHMHPRQAMPSIPTYRMGQGHALFFADKGRWLLRRHAELRQEMVRRGHSVNYELDLSHWPPEAMGDWEPDVDAKLCCVARVINRAASWR